MLTLDTKRRLLLLTLIAAVLVGCGKKGPPRPDPDGVQLSVTGVLYHSGCGFAGKLK